MASGITQGSGKVNYVDLRLQKFCARSITPAPDKFEVSWIQFVRSRLPPERSQSEPTGKTVFLGAVREADRTSIGQGLGDEEKEGLEEPGVIGTSGIQGCAGEGVVVIANRPAMIGRVGRVLLVGGIACEDPRFPEGRRISIHDLDLNRLGGEPFLVRVVVPLAPGAEQAQGHEGEWGIAVRDSWYLSRRESFGGRLGAKC